jgi:hypothetical protein
VQVVFNLTPGTDTDTDGIPDTFVFGGTSDEYFPGYADRGEEIRFSIPTGTYRGMMFLGMVSSRKLLAVGVVKSTTDVLGTETNATDGVFNVTDATRYITFEVEALHSDIANTTQSVGSSFKITSPTGFETLKDTDADVTPDTDVPSGKTEVVGGEEVPYFNIPSKNTEPAEDSGSPNPLAILGTFTVGGLPAVLNPTPGTALDLTDDMVTEGWLGVETATKQAQTIAVPAYNTRTKVNLDPVAVTPTILSLEALDGELVWNFHLTTSTTPGLTDGFAKIQFYAGVQAFKYGQGSTGDKGDVWYIANGYNPGALDAGDRSVGQNVLLLVGEQNILDNPDIVILGADVN